MVDYCKALHVGRRLAWLTNMGSADLRATFGDGVKRELSVSTYQMCILLLFNDADTLSYQVGGPGGLGAAARCTRVQAACFQCSKLEHAKLLGRCRLNSG